MLCEGKIQKTFVKGVPEFKSWGLSRQQLSKRSLEQTGDRLPWTECHLGCLTGINISIFRLLLSCFDGLIRSCRDEWGCSTLVHKRSHSIRSGSVSEDVVATDPLYDYMGSSSQLHFGHRLMLEGVPIDSTPISQGDSMPPTRGLHR